MANINKAIVSIMKDIGSISKDKKNQKHGYQYRGVDDVMNALYPALVENGVFIIPKVLETKREERTSNAGNNLIFTTCKMSYTFCAEDDSKIEVIMSGEGMDSGDKSMNKAMSAAYKYACFQLFCIPTEDLKDPDMDTYIVEDRRVTAEEVEMLKKAADRTGMKLDEMIGRLSKYGIKRIEDISVSRYTKWMIKMANAESIVPHMPEGAEVGDPDATQEELPFDK